MGMVTIHLVIGVGVLILPLCLILLFCLSWLMSLANLYIIIGAISFVTSVVTTIILGTKFINQPAAHGYFSYSDTLASALLSLGLLLDGVLPFDYFESCYQYYLIYGLFVIPIVTGFFSVLGMAIERFQAFAVYRDTRVVTRRFSISWFFSSWTLALCFVVILVGQIQKAHTVDKGDWKHEGKDGDNVYVLASSIFPGPHCVFTPSHLDQVDLQHQVDLVLEGDQAEDQVEDQAEDQAEDQVEDDFTDADRIPTAEPQPATAAEP